MELSQYQLWGWAKVNTEFGLGIVSSQWSVREACSAMVGTSVPETLLLVIRVHTAVSLLQRVSRSESILVCV